MIDWVREAKFVAESEQDNFILVCGRSPAFDRMLDIMGNGYVTGFSRDEMILALLFYKEYCDEK
jgi:hypothetical protein